MPGNLQNLKPLTSERARLIGEKGRFMRRLRVILRDMVHKALGPDGEVSCIALARWTNASIMANTALSPSIRLAASEPFLKGRPAATTAIQINFSPDKRASQVTFAPPAAAPVPQPDSAEFSSKKEVVIPVAECPR